MISGNTLRAAVLGANDGLVSNLSLVMGVAGASSSDDAVLIAGLAGLLAGASSMALGEWLSVQSARELFQRQIQIERRELSLKPEAKQAQLTRIFQGRGLGMGLARAVSAALMAHGRGALDTLTRHKLGVDPEQLGGSAGVAAATSFGLFAVGAVVPVIPFAILNGTPAIATSLVLGGLGLFAVGAGITRVTGRSAFFSGARQVLVGLAAAALTYGVGRLLGVAIAG